MAHYNAHGTLDTVEYKYEGRYVFGKSLDDRYVSSVCDISGLRISGRQFVPCEGIRKGEKMFDFKITIAVMGKKYQFNTVVIYG
jgi:hypothetical protein